MIIQCTSSPCLLTDTSAAAAMPREKSEKKSVKLRHEPLGNEMEKPSGKLKPSSTRGRGSYDKDDDNDNNAVDDMDLEARAPKLGKGGSSASKSNITFASASDDDFEDDDLLLDKDEEEDGDTDQLVEYDGDYITGSNMSEAEENLVQKFLSAGRAETRSLADIIMDKLREKEEQQLELGDEGETAAGDTGTELQGQSLPPKVIEVYSALGKMLKHYKSGKLPKALKMLPHLKNWEEILWLTRPDEWSPLATYACTKIFSSNLNTKLTQRYLNLVLLEKCRDDIRINAKLNYHLYMALKKALYKPAAFYKGLLLPLAQSRTCSLREATIISSVLAKVSIPSDHSAAALLRLAEMPYSGSTSLFIKVLLNKKYALPRRVIDSVCTHFFSFEEETRDLPVIWHQSLLVFAQRYKKELSEEQKEGMKSLLKKQAHHQITQEVRRELFYKTEGDK